MPPKDPWKLVCKPKIEGGLGVILARRYRAGGWSEGEDEEQSVVAREEEWGRGVRRKFKAAVH
jgi:hypothetical protein